MRSFILEGAGGAIWAEAAATASFVFACGLERATGELEETQAIVCVCVCVDSIELDYDESLC